MGKQTLLLKFFILWSMAATSMSQIQGAESWRAGAASIDITPAYPVRLSGYGSRTTEFESVAQHLHAKALALFWKDEPPVVIVTVDNCGVPSAVRHEILSRLAKAGHAIAEERFALHSSHTHCAPMLSGMLPFLFGTALPPEHAKAVDRYTEDLTTHVVEVVTKALSSPQPAKLDWGSGSVRFASNRRLQTPTGFSNAPNPYGPVDHALPLLRVTNQEDKLLALFTSYACHCTTLGFNQIHADWAGCAQEELELRFPGVVAMTAIGCGADQNPYPRKEISFAIAHGVALAKEVVRLLGTPLKTVNGPPQCNFKEIMLPYEGLPSVEALQQAKAGTNKWNAFHASYYLDLLAKGEKPPSALPYAMQTTTFGNDLLFINLAGEVVVDYSLRFKREYDPARTWVNAYTNDVPCYIPSQRVWNEGGYEAGGAMIFYGRPSRFAPGIEEIIARSIQEMIPAAFRAETK